MLLRILLALTGYLVSVSPLAGTALEGLESWHAGNRAEAIDSWQLSAAQGDAESSLFLGYVYRQGLGVGRDYAVAARWYRRAAESGLAEAQYELALMYELGLGVDQDAAEAARWYGLSSAQSCPSELSAGGRLGGR